MTENLGQSEAFIEFQQQISLAAKVDRPVLIIGERGSGKEMAASRLHYLSDRWQNPFVTINCAALPQSLIETELFGHEAGSFTGASKARKGRFEEANRGTIFLDEIGLIPQEVQEKILRAVEYGTFERVGSSKTFEVDTRIIGATNADLPQLCKEGKFKQDLLDRLSFEVLFLPPLRERHDDILYLSNYFINRMALEMNREIIPSLSQDVAQKLLAYPWPGNIRELKNTIERAVYKCEGETITSVTINPFKNPYPPVESADTSEDFDAMVTAGKEEYDIGKIPLKDFPSIQKDVVIYFLQKALNESDGKQKAAASLLGLSYDQFRAYYRKYREFFN